MDFPKIAALTKSPALLANSAWLSARHQRKQAGDLPIVAHRSGRIERHAGARLELGGELTLGYWPNGTELPGSRPALLQLGPGSCLTTSGWVILGGGVRLQLRPRAQLTIGEGTYMTADVTVTCAGRMTIGRECAIARGVTVMDSDDHALTVDGIDRDMQAPVVLEDKVWIGTGATILKGVRLGQGSVVGAASVVTRDVGAFDVVAGSPARVIGRNAVWH